jgi:hypothetical protein
VREIAVALKIPKSTVGRELAELSQNPGADAGVDEGSDPSGDPAIG